MKKSKKIFDDLYNNIDQLHSTVEVFSEDILDSYDNEYDLDQNLFELINKCNNYIKLVQNSFKNIKIKRTFSLDLGKSCKK